MFSAIITSKQISRTTHNWCASCDTALVKKHSTFYRRRLLMAG